MKGLNMKTTFTLQEFFQDSELKVDFNSKLKRANFNSFVKMLKVFKLRTNANQNLILSALVEKSLTSKNKDSVFLFCKTFEAVNLGISRSTLERFFFKLITLGIIVKIASKEIETSKTISAYAFNADKLQEFMDSELKFNAYYKSIFGDEKKQKSMVSEKDKIEYLENLVKALKQEVAIRDDKIMELQKGQKIYDEAEVEALNEQNSELREKLAGMVEACDKLANELKVRADDNLASLEAENAKLKEELSKAKNIENLQESQEYQDLIESNVMLKSTALRLSNENEELRKEIERIKAENSNTDDSEKVKELNERLMNAVQTFKQQKAEIEALKQQPSNDDIEKIRKESDEKYREKYNEMLRTQWDGKLQKKMDLLEEEYESKVAAIVELQNAGIDELKNRIKELEAEVANNKNAENVSISLGEFVEKALPELNKNLNPMMREIIAEDLRKMAVDFTKQYAKDSSQAQQDINNETRYETIDELIPNGLELLEKREAPKPIHVESYSDEQEKIESDEQEKIKPIKLDKNGYPPVWEQDDLPF